MRKLLTCVLMMTLLLSGCKAGGSGESPEELAGTIREEYQNMAGWSAAADLTVDYGDKVFDFTMDVQWRRDGETVLTVTAPELLSGITARVAEKETVLEYDGAGLSLGALDGDGLTPVSAVTALMEHIDQGYMAQWTWTGPEDSQLSIRYQDPEQAKNEGTEFLLTFDRTSHALLEAEVSSAGTTVLTVGFSNFTMELKSDDTGNGPHMG